MLLLGWTNTSSEIKHFKSNWSTTKTDTISQRGRSDGKFCREQKLTSFLVFRLDWAHIKNLSPAMHKKPGSASQMWRHMFKPVTPPKLTLTATSPSPMQISPSWGDEIALEGGRFHLAPEAPWGEQLHLCSNQKHKWKTPYFEQRGILM